MARGWLPGYLGVRNRFVNNGVYYMITKRPSRSDSMSDVYYMPDRLRNTLHGKRGRVRFVLVALILLGLLFMTATLGGALHHHQDSTSENTCPICHLNHQPMEKPIVSDRLPALRPVGPNPEPFDYEFAPDPMTRRVPARAPPSV